LRRQPSLRSQLNQIRLWVRQGRTDAWIAHKLDVSIEQLERFKRDHDLLGEEAAPGRPADPLSVPAPDFSLYEDDEESEEEEDEVDEEEPVGALLEEPEDEEERPARDRSRDRSRSRGRGRSRERSRDSYGKADGKTDRKAAPSRRAEADLETEADAESDDSADGDDYGKTAPARRRRRGRRGGRGRRRASSLEATFDHGEDGYGLWLDPAVVDNPVYAQHWAGHREVEVTFDQDSITIRRARTDSDDSGRPADDDDDQ
jgi:hypothetical protein